LIKRLCFIFAPIFIVIMTSSFASVSFDNTEIAFAYKSDKELKQAHLLFSSMQYPFLVNWGTRLTPWAIRAGLPVKGLIRNTLFRQFVGGETLDATAAVATRLGNGRCRLYWIMALKEGIMVRKDTTMPAMSFCG
jgi:hypothetical protein